MLHLSAVKAEVACCLKLLVTCFALHEGFQRNMGVWAEFGPLFFPRPFLPIRLCQTKVLHLARPASKSAPGAPRHTAFMCMALSKWLPKMNACDTSDQINQIRVPFRTQFLSCSKTASHCGLPQIVSTV